MGYVYCTTCTRCREKSNFLSPFGAQLLKRGRMELQEARGVYKTQNCAWGKPGSWRGVRGGGQRSVLEV